MEIRELWSVHMKCLSFESNNIILVIFRFYSRLIAKASKGGS